MSRTDQKSIVLYLGLKGTSTIEIYDDLVVTLGVKLCAMAPSGATFATGVLQVSPSRTQMDRQIGCSLNQMKQFGYLGRAAFRVGSPLNASDASSSFNSLPAPHSDARLHSSTSSLGPIHFVGRRQAYSSTTFAPSSGIAGSSEGQVVAEHHVTR
jgi:hypothetical protein